MSKKKKERSLTLQDKIHNLMITNYKQRIQEKIKNEEIIKTLEVEEESLVDRQHIRDLTQGIATTFIAHKQQEFSQVLRSTLPVNDVTVFSTYEEAQQALEDYLKNSIKLQARALKRVRKRGLTLKAKWATSCSMKYFWRITNK